VRTLRLFGSVVGDMIDVFALLDLLLVYATPPFAVKLQWQGGAGLIRTSNVSKITGPKCTYILYRIGVHGIIAAQSKECCIDAPNPYAR
jgi:hypothetical protein